MTDAPKPHTINLLGVEDLLASNELLKERDTLRALLERIHDQASGPDGLRYRDPLMAELERTIGTWKRKGNAAP